MSQIKVKFINNGCGPITVFGRPRIEIPSSGEVEVLMPADGRTPSLLERLHREYPSLVISKTALTTSGQGNAVPTKTAAPTEKTDTKSASKDKNTTSQATA